MKFPLHVILLLPSFTAVANTSTSPPTPQQPITWKHSEARALPVVSNFFGASNLRPDGFSIGPITLGGFNGNFFNSSLSIDGSPFKLDQLTWESCSGTRTSNAAQNISVVTRMPLDERVILQQIKPISQQQKTIRFQFDGPFFRTCDDEDPSPNDPGYPSSCGWGLGLPTDRSNFKLSIINDNDSSAAIMMVEDTLSKAVSASSLVSTCRDFKIEVVNDGFVGEGSMAAGCSLQHIIAVADSVEEASALLSKHSSDFDKSFFLSCTDWTHRFQSAFDVEDDFFSGHLPTLTTKDEDMSNLYTWSANAQISLMRTSMQSAPRQYVISEGASNSYDGSLGMGGSGQFIWDLSFSAATLSLLDPTVALDILKHVVSNADFQSHPIGVPQAWDSFLPYPNTVGGGQYAFDYIASFIYLQSYFTLTGDMESLTTPLVNNHEVGESYSPLDFMRRIASNYIHYPKATKSNFLAGEKNSRAGEAKMLSYSALTLKHHDGPVFCDSFRSSHHSSQTTEVTSDRFWRRLQLTPMSSPGCKQETPVCSFPLRASS